MLVIGLTGGSGTGKGCVCSIFEEYGIPSIDTDKTSRLVCDVGKPCLSELVKLFGSSILNDDGSLNRPALASIAFSDTEKHKLLNKTTHFYILNEVRSWLELQKSDGKIAAIVDAPLLYESGFDTECDLVIAVTAPIDTRIQRILSRDGITLEQAELRLSKQHPDLFYTKKADYVISNGGSLDDLKKQIDAVFNDLKERKKI